MSKKKKRLFANAIICICLAVCGAVTTCVIYEYHRLNVVMPSGVISALLGLWGSELLIIALRQIFGSDITAKKKQIEEESI